MNCQCGVLLADCSPVDQLHRYISAFGDKPCCFADLRLYTDLMSADEQRQVMNSFHLLMIVAAQLSLAILLGVHWKVHRHVTQFT